MDSTTFDPESYDWTDLPAGVSRQFDRVGMQAAPDAAPDWADTEPTRTPVSVAFHVKTHAPTEYLRYQFVPQDIVEAIIEIAEDGGDVDEEFTNYIRRPSLDGLSTVTSYTQDDMTA
jgi:hypothetical protein